MGYRIDCRAAGAYPGNYSDMDGLLRSFKITILIVTLVVFSVPTCKLECVENNAQRAETWTDNGVIHLEKGEYGKALKCFYRALVYAPDNTEIQAYIARTKALLEKSARGEFAIPLFSSGGPHYIDEKSLEKYSHEKDEFTDSEMLALEEAFLRESREAPKVQNSVKVSRGNTREKVCALTFDDGPHPVNTPKLLEILDREKVPATFFVLGSRCNAYPDVFDEIIRHGHEIANHSWSHPFMSRKSTERIDSEIERTSSLIEKHTGKAPRFFRPPYGAMNPYLYTKARQDNFKIVMWSVDSLDYRGQPKNVIVNRCLKQMHPGAIILFHDIQKRTVEVIPDLIREIKKMGYTFVTLSYLLGMDDSPFMGGEEETARTVEKANEEKEDDFSDFQFLAHEMYSGVYPLKNSVSREKK